MEDLEKFFAKCVACGRNGAKVFYNGKMFCIKCASLFNTCAMCKHSRTCNFEIDPTPEPQFIVKTIRQQVPGGFVEQTAQFPNGERIIRTCIDGRCICYGEVDEKPKCMRQFGICKNYDEFEF